MVRQAPSGEFGVTPSDRMRIMRELLEMREIVDSHLRELPESERENEEYRLEFVFPLLQYLSRGYFVLFPELVRELR